MASCAVYDEGTLLKIEKNGREQIMHKIGLGTEYIDNFVTLHDASGRKALLNSDCCTYPGGCENGLELQETIMEMIKRPFPMVNNMKYWVGLGKAYTVSHIFENVVKDTERLVLLKVGTSHKFHPIFTVNFGGQAFIYIYENPVLATNGTPINIRNLSRESTNTSDGEAFYNTTVSSFGTLQLSSYFVPGATKVGSVGGSIDEPYFELAREHDYVVRIINKSDATQNGSIQIVYYED